MHSASLLLCLNGWWSSEEVGNLYSYHRAEGGSKGYKLRNFVKVKCVEGFFEFLSITALFWNSYGEILKFVGLYNT